MRVWPDALMQALGALPLPVLRGLGRVVGAVLYIMVPQRRRVVLTNLRLCFPHWGEARRRQVARAVFVRFAQAWLDRGWLWHASPELLKRQVAVPHDQALTDSACCSCSNLYFDAGDVATCGN